MPDRPGSRRFPRMARVNEVVREVVAEELERLADVDERLELVTVTAVEVDPGLRRATVLLSSLTDDTRAALLDHRGRLQAAIGEQVRLKRTPQLSFAADPGVERGKRVEDILRGLSADPGGEDGDGTQ
ncbi:MAG TPA: ribosome-binding factor A [Acidimicrobiales bacterium]|nr:ribosome-binding factor A [Acidimicrobiales bacterium]